MKLSGYPGWVKSGWAIRKRTEGKVYTEPTDYFVCPEEVKKVFGGLPRKLRIMFPTNDPAQWASRYLRCYSNSRRLICQGNGKTAVARVYSGASDAELREKQCIPGSCVAYQQEICRQVMNLQFLIPDCPGFGIYQLATSSYRSMNNINFSLERIYKTYHRFALIPLTLRLVEKKVQPEGQPKTVWVLKLKPTYSLTATQRYAQMPPEQALVLPSPDNEVPDDLFLEEHINNNSQSQRSKEEEELIELWDRVTRKVWLSEMRDYQIARFFLKHFHLEVGLTDFCSPMPPAKFNIENLSGFLKDIEIQTRFS